MAIHHAKSGEVVALPLGEALAAAETTALVKTSEIEVLRLVIPLGKEIAMHKAPGPITVQCLEGRIAFSAHGSTQELDAGKFLYLETGEPHALTGIENSSVLVTIVLK
jgi:quercetin dioxygenase-like cupin family protein